MINFADEWSVNALMKSRQEMLYRDSARIQVVRVPAGRRRASRLRRDIGLWIVHLGERLLSVDGSPIQSPVPHQSPR